MATYFPVSGDITGSVPVTTLSTTGITAGVYTDSAITIDAKGRATTAATYSAITTSGTNTVLTSASAYQQQFTGSSAQTVTLPDTSTIPTGRSFLISNLSSASVTVQTFGGTSIMDLPQGTSRVFTCISTANNFATSWKFSIVPATMIAQSPSVSYTFAQLYQSAANSSTILGLAYHTSGDIIMAGYYFTSITIGATTLNSSTTGYDGYIARLTSSGTAVWAVKTNGTGNLNVSNITCDIDSSGNIFVSLSIVAIGGGTLAPAGVGVLSPGNSSKQAVLKLNSSGTFLWSAMNSSTLDAACGTEAIAVNRSTGDAYVCGRFSGTGTIIFNGALNAAATDKSYIAKINTSGVWQTQAEGTGPFSRAKGVTIDSSGNPIMTGHCQGSGSTNFSPLGPFTGGAPDNVYIVKYNSSLVAQWVTLGTCTGSAFCDISIDSSDNLYVGGSGITGTLTFSGLPAVSVTNEIFTVKLNSSGTPQWIIASTSGGGSSSFLSQKPIVTTSAGNSYLNITCFTSGTFSFGGQSVTNTNGTGRHVVLKLNNAGGCQWIKNGGPVSPTGATAYPIITDGFGSIYASVLISATSTYATTPPTVLTVTTSLAGALIKLNEQEALPAIRTISSSTYTALSTDYSMIFRVACTVTLLPASTAQGRILYIKNTANVAVTSASANVVPMASTTAGTAILEAIAGKWVMLQSDGVNWVTIGATKGTVPYNCEVYNTYGGAFSIGAGPTTVTWNTIKTDPYSMFNGTTTITVPVAGIYSINVGHFMTQTNPNNGLQALFIKVGAETVGNYYIDYSNVPTYIGFAGVYAVVNCAAGAQISVTTNTGIYSAFGVDNASTRFRVTLLT